MREWMLAALCALACLWTAPASALSFVFTTVSGDSLTTGQATAFQQAADAWSSYFSDPITVNLQIGFRSLGANILGSTSASFVYAGTSVVKSQLALDAKDADDAQAVASLSDISQGNILLTSAQARALNFSTPVASDATIEFSSNFTFSDTRYADGSIAPNTYDLVGVAEHEIGHVLGFESNIDLGFSYNSLLDAFRYSSVNTRSAAAGAAYFSIDGGATDIADFAPGGSGNYQASHWAYGTNALMAPTIAAGQTENITALDARAMNVLGYDLITAVPEPASWSLMILGFGAIGIAKRRERARSRLDSLRIAS